MCWLSRDVLAAEANAITGLAARLGRDTDDLLLPTPISSGRALPIVDIDAPLSEAVVSMSGKGMGMTAVADAHEYVADGDLPGACRACAISRAWAWPTS